MNSSTPWRRARSDARKENRREDILRAARTVIEIQGFDGMTMQALAESVGLSKGALYLYFRRKEELLLALFEAALETLVRRLEGEARSDNLVHLMSELPGQVPLFLPLLARLVPMIESQVSDDCLFEAKRRMQGQGARVARLLTRLTGVSDECAAQATLTLLLAMQGAAQSDLLAGRAPQSLPADLRSVFAGHAFAVRFPPAARMILAGLQSMGAEPDAEGAAGAAGA